MPNPREYSRSAPLGNVQHRKREAPFPCRFVLVVVFFCSDRRLFLEVPAVESKVTDENRRVLAVTPGNLRQSHLYIRNHYDFFPSDCFGPARKRGLSNGGEVEIFLDGLNEVVKTDIATDARTGKPRGFFRARTWVRRFFEHHKITAGDRLEGGPIPSFCRRSRHIEHPPDPFTSYSKLIRFITASELFADSIVLF